ncbi:hypothetical protein M0804_001017 [Polistes exclamans]|nr:hypothetical protein M0804_001017 [Polistes exclamans]
MNEGNNTTAGCLEENDKQKHRADRGRPVLPVGSGIHLQAQFQRVLYFGLHRVPLNRKGAASVFRLTVNYYDDYDNSNYAKRANNLSKLER